MFEKLFAILRPQNARPKTEREPEEYRAYTSKFDLEISPSHLARLDRSQPTIGFQEAQRLFDEALARWRTEADVAAIDASGRIHDALTQQELKGTIVSILIDHSGSMKGQRAMLVAAMTVVLADFLSRLGVAYEILGFTTRTWHGGKSRRLWKWSGRPANPGRLCDLLHIIYRPATDISPGVPRSIRNLLRPDLLKENVDGEAIQWACARLRAHCQIRKSLVVVSDGAPVDDSTLMENGADYLVRHLKQVLKAEQEAQEIEIAGLGIDYDVSRYYATHARVNAPADFAKVAIPFFEQLILRGATPQP